MNQRSHSSILDFEKFYDLASVITFQLFSMSKGTVKFFNEAKGFGFIVEEGTNKEVFVHVSGLIDKITKDDHVEFNIAEGQKGINAVDVKKI